MQDGQVISGHSLGRRLAPGAAVESVQRVGEHMLLLIAKLVQCAWFDSGDLPRLATAKFHQQDGAGERFKELAANLLQ